MIVVVEVIPYHGFKEKENITKGIDKDKHRVIVLEKVIMIETQYEDE